MANNYTNNWSQSRPTLDRSNLHLEREYDFGSLSANSSSQPQRQAGFQDMYASSSYQIPSNGITPQSSLSSAFLSDQSQSGGRVASFGSHQAAMQTSSNPMVASNNNVYSSGQNQSQMQATYSASLRNQAGNRPTWNNSASFNFQSPLPGSSQYPPTDSNAAAAGSYLSASPGPMQETFSANASYYPPRVPKSDSRAKRPYTQLQDDQRDEDQDHDFTPDPKESNKGKSGACARCKSLKVKCEFKTDTDPCRRCLNGGHDCVIPGRKKRRAPPKREHLMNQIREQGAQIKELMTQLEKLNASGLSNHRSSSVTSDAPTSSPTLQSPVLSPSAASDSLFESDAPLPSGSPKMSPEANKAIEDWIAKARETFQELDGFIGMGGAGMPKSYLVKEDLENPENSDDEFVEVPPSDEEEYEFDIEHDGDEPNGGRNTAPLRHASSASSLGTDTAAQLRKRSSGESSKPAILPGGAAPFGLFGDLSLKTSRRKGTGSEAENEADKAPGIANTNFFRSTPAPESVDNRLASFPQQAPYILTRGIITPQEAEKLFHIYFEEMNLSLSLLDPVLYTAQRTCYRSPFLFTVICAIASRFYEEKPSLYPQLMHYAQLAAGTALIGGPKNVEMCSGYLLLSLYPIPAKRWEDQRSWLYLGLAIRTATDLNLHLPNTAKPLNENHAREMLNRTRVWLNLFNVDRSTSSQYGRKPIIPNSDYMANHSENWWCSSPYNMKNFDIQLCAYNSDAIIISEFLAKIYSDPHHPTGLNKEADFERIATETDDRLKQTGDRWFEILEKTDMSDPQNSFRTGLLRLAYPYARLVALSYGFQHAFGKNNTDENPFLIRCLSAATDVLDAVVNDICRPSQRHYWRHGPEAQSVFITFASAFLVKLLQPKFASYLSMEKRMEIRERVQRVVDLLSSPEIAIDDRHGPKLYAKFLKGLLASPLARVDTSPAASMRKTRVAKSPSGGQPPEVNSNIQATTAASPHHHDIMPNASNHPSPAHSGSLSPPPRKMAMSFDSFAPSGATDPFIPDLGLSSTINLSENSNVDMTYFSSFDDSILQSMQTVSDPSGWQDTVFPAGFNWMAEFERDVNMSYSTQPATTLFNDSIQYMTGV